MLQYNYHLPTIINENVYSIRIKVKRQMNRNGMASSGKWSSIHICSITSRVYMTFQNAALTKQPGISQADVNMVIILTEYV